MFQIELLPAFYGDCILITYGAGRARSRVLIDAGTTPTWKKALRRHLPEGTELELFVLTHVDADHIAGAIPFLHQGTDVEIRDVWFNGWRHLPSSGLLSARQGEIFSTLITDRRLPWNHAFDGETATVTEDRLPEVTLDGGLRLTLLSPTLKKLSRLARQWKKELVRHGLTPGAHRLYRQFLARHPTLSTDVPKLAVAPFRADSSAPNGSSIALLAEFEGEALLLASDAHASVLTQSIERLLAERGEERLRLDACKVSHHGSRGNTNSRLLSLLDCPRYLISCNGDVHNLPDNETIGRIIHLGGQGPDLLFNYHCPRTKVWEKPELQERYGYRAVYGTDGYFRLDFASPP